MVAGKRIGEVAKGTLIKKGPQVAYFRIYDGFGVAREAIEHPNVYEVELHYQQKVYRALTKTFKEHGLPYRQLPYEPQLILKRKYWSVYDPNQLVLL